MPVETECTRTKFVKFSSRKKIKHKVHKGDGGAIYAPDHQRRTSGHHLDIDVSSFLIVLRVSQHDDIAADGRRAANPRPR
jgi:hypothetical protein